MSSKRTLSQRKRAARPMASAQTQGPAGRWRQIGLVLTMLPMLAGIVLFVAAWADWVFLGSQMGQTMTGALLALLGFAASNALQGRWLLAGGWAGLGIAVALLVGVQQSWAQMFGGLLGGVGVVLLLVEFARRLQAQSRR